MEKVYSNSDEKKWFTAWKNNDIFKIKKSTIPVTFSILLPPLSVSGPPRIGHALALTIPDIIVRRKHMQGINTLWLPWLGDGNNNNQTFQLAEQLGLALDWSLSNTFTTEKLNAISTKIFIQLINKKYIYCKQPDSNQWMLKVSRVVKAVNKAIEKGEIVFTPGKWRNLFLDWTKNLKDLCISCMPENGFPIPAYSCNSCQQIMVTEPSPDSCKKCNSTSIQQVPAGLMPWFVSALFPFAALGWNEDNSNYNVFYPTSLMITGADSFFIQAARMIMLDLLVTGHVPFREVMVRGMGGITQKQLADPSHYRRRNPIEFISRYGADAFRFTIAIQAGFDSDFSISLSRIKGSRAFANKIWNAARFILDSLQGTENSDINFNSITDADKWILHSLNNTVVKLNDLMDNHRIDDAAKLVYHFVRHEFCDWYLELFKLDVTNPDSRTTLKLTFNCILRLLHPFMPFITDDIYRRINGEGTPFLINTLFPAIRSEWVFSVEFGAMEMMKKIVGEVRKIRNENNIHPNKHFPILLKTGSKKESDLLSVNFAYFNRFTHSSRTEIVPDFSAPVKGFKGSYLNWDILLPIESDEERLNAIARLQKEQKRIESRIKTMEKKVSSPHFLKKTADSEVLDLKKKLQTAISRRNKIQITIENLS